MLGSISIDSAAAGTQENIVVERLVGVFPEKLTAPMIDIDIEPRSRDMKCFMARRCDCNIICNSECSKRFYTKSCR